MGRAWNYAYTGSDLTSVTDPMSNTTTYTYGAGNTGNPQLANDLLTITGPNAQPGGPDAGDATVNVYNASGQVKSQTDPMGSKTSLNYCVNAAAGDCMNSATGTGYITVTEPDGNTTIDYYVQGALAAETNLTGGAAASESDFFPNETAGGTGGGTLTDTAITDGDGNVTSYAYDAAGNRTAVTSPDGVGTQTATTTDTYTSAEPGQLRRDARRPPRPARPVRSPAPVAPGGVITPPSSAPPLGVTWTLYDTDGNQLYSTTGVYQPGSTTASYARTTYQLFKGNAVTLNGTNITCTNNTPPSLSLPCAKINADGVVTQLAYDSAGDLTSSATPDGNGSEVATTTYAYDGDGEQTATTLPDGNLSGANAGNYTTVTTYNADGEQTIRHARQEAAGRRSPRASPATATTPTATRSPSPMPAGTPRQRPTTPATSRPWSPTRTATPPSPATTATATPSRPFRPRAWQRVA